MAPVPFRQIARILPVPTTLSLATVLLAAIAAPVRALEVRFTPDRPQLGDTLSVTVQLDDTDAGDPRITLGDRDYPAFEIAPNQFRALLPTTPLEAPGERKVIVRGDGEVRHFAVWIGDRAFPTQSIWLPPGKASIQGTDFEFDRVAQFKQLVTPDKLWNGPFARPNGGAVTTIYGVRRYYNGEFANDYYHRGVDYAAALGSPVVAPAGGRVALVGLESQGFELHGNTVGIDHGQGVTSIFLHLNSINVKEGDIVRPGQTIGTVGSSGISTGPHLHWGLYVHGQAIDPVPWRFEGID